MKQGSGKSAGKTGEGDPKTVSTGGSKPAGEAAAPEMRRAAFCKKCGSEMTYKGVYYADGTAMYYCPGCNATMHHVNGPCPYEFRNVPVGSTPTPPKPPTTTTLPTTTTTPVTTSSSSSSFSPRPTKGKSGGTLVYCKNAGCNNAKEVLMGDTTAPWECSSCFMKRYNQEHPQETTKSVNEKK